MNAALPECMPTKMTYPSTLLSTTDLGFYSPLGLLIALNWMRITKRLYLMRIWLFWIPPQVADFKNPAPEGGNIEIE